MSLNFQVKPIMHHYMRSICLMKIVSREEALIHLKMMYHESWNLHDREWCSWSRRPTGYSQTSCLSSPWLCSACQQHHQSRARKSLSYQAAGPTQRKSESTVGAVWIEWRFYTRWKQTWVSIFLWIQFNAEMKSLQKVKEDKEVFTFKGLHDLIQSCTWNVLLSHFSVHSPLIVQVRK